MTPDYLDKLIAQTERGDWNAIRFIEWGAGKRGTVEAVVYRKNGTVAYRVRYVPPGRRPTHVFVTADMGLRKVQ